MEDGLVKHIFYEKPTVGNQVLRRDTALPTASIRSTLLQETVRRMLNTSVDTEPELVNDILSKYAQKLVNSGHSQLSTKIFIVQGVTKFLHKVKISRLPVDHPQYKPLYMAKEYNENQRQVDKFLAKMNWFRSRPNKLESGNDIEDWRDRLKGVWRGSNISQRKVKMMQYSTILQVPNT